MLRGIAKRDRVVVTGHAGTFRFCPPQPIASAYQGRFDRVREARGPLLLLIYAEKAEDGAC